MIDNLDKNDNLVTYIVNFYFFFLLLLLNAMSLSISSLIDTLCTFDFN